MSQDEMVLVSKRRLEALEKVAQAADVLLSYDRATPLSRDERRLLEALNALPEYSTGADEEAMERG